MKSRPLYFLVWTSHAVVFALLGLAFLSGCSTPAARAAKRDIAAIQRNDADAEAALQRAQAANAQMAADSAKIKENNADLRNDAQRIEDKAVVLLKSRWGN